MPPTAERAGAGAVPFRPYTIGRLETATFDAFADLVERSNRIYDGCWCIANLLETQQLLCFVVPVPVAPDPSRPQKPDLVRVTRRQGQGPEPVGTRPNPPA